MSGFFVVLVVIVVLVVFLSRGAAARRRRMLNRIGEQVARSIQVPDASGTEGLGQDIAQAVQQALSRQGLPTGSVSIKTSISTGGGPFTEVAAAGGLAGIEPTDLGVGEVLSTSSLSGSRVATIELDAIGEPKRRVTVDLPADAEVARGDRLYVRLDPARPDTAAYLPGMRPPETSNRLDPLVLQPMLLAKGEAGQAVVRRAETTSFDTPLPSGASAWRLDLEVSPRNGFPYRAEVLTTVSTPEKAARICHEGAELAIRYDPADPKTIVIDTAAMGLAAPPPTTTAAFEIPGFESMGLIERVKAVRERSGLGLKEAKDLAEAMAADPAAFGRTLAALGRQPNAASATLDWSSLQGMGKIEKIKAVRERTGLGLSQAKDLVERIDGGGTAAGDTTAAMIAMLSGKTPS